MAEQAATALRCRSISIYPLTENMPHLLEVGLKRELTAAEARRFPFTVPAIRELPLLDVEVPVTIFVGENGSGKSTLLEAMAVCAGLRSFGASDPASDDSLAKQHELANVLRMAWRPRLKLTRSRGQSDYDSNLDTCIFNSNSRGLTKSRYE